MASVKRFNVVQERRQKPDRFSLSFAGTVESISIKADIFHIMADALEVIASAKISKYGNKKAKKMDTCFYHSKHKYRENEKYRLTWIEFDENSKNVLYYLK